MIKLLKMMMTQQEFSNTVSDSNIPDYNNSDALAENIPEPVLKAIVKYRNHPNILTMQKEPPIFF